MTTLAGNTSEPFAVDAAAAARIVTGATFRQMVENMRHTKSNDSTYTPEMKRAMNDTLNCLAQDIALRFSP